jgi:hypothetical protein
VFSQLQMAYGSQPEASSLGRRNATGHLNERRRSRFTKVAAASSFDTLGMTEKNRTGPAAKKSFVRWDNEQRKTAPSLGRHDDRLSMTAACAYLLA